MTNLLRRRPVPMLIIGGIAVLCLATAYIHLTLGSLSSLMGILFLANAAGYVALALAVTLVASLRVPIVRRFGWLAHVALAGFTAMTIAGYLVMGPYFMLGWITKVIEVGIILLLVLDVVRVYGSPAGLARSAVTSLRRADSPAAA